MSLYVRRITALFMAIALLASLSACGQNESQPSSESNNETAAPTEPAQEGTQTSDSAEGDAEDAPLYGGSASYYIQDLKTYYAPEMDELCNYALWFESLWAIDWSINDPSVAAFDSTYITYDQVAGQIADSWKWDEAAMTLTVTIRDDVTFQTLDSAYDYYGGRTVTADDVKYSYDRLLGIGSGWDTPVTCDTDWPSRLYMIDSITSDGAQTVVFQFNTSSEVALNSFMTYFVNICGPEWDALTADQQSDWHYACGTGPYILSDYAADSYLTFVKNENYYDYDERYPGNKLPYMDEITLVYIPDSANLVSQFISGSLDYIGWNNNLLNSSEIQLLKDSLSDGSYMEVTNYNAAQGIGLRSNVEPFNDLRVRKAMQMAINIDEINDQFYGYTNAAVISGLWDTSTAWSAVDQWDDELKAEYSYDPEGAKALLAEAGYPDGFTFTVMLGPVANTELYTLVVDYFAAVGITMELQTCANVVELNGYIQDPSNTDCFFQTGGNFNQLTIPSLILRPENGFGYENERFLELMDELNTIQTLDEVAEVANEMDLIFSREHWLIQCGGLTEVSSFMSGRIGGYTGEKLRANSNMRTVTARLWCTDAG